jgi:hypothetical protein
MLTAFCGNSRSAMCTGHKQSARLRVIEATLFCIEQTYDVMKVTFLLTKKPVGCVEFQSLSNPEASSMSYRKLLAVAVLTGIIGSTAACADATGPQQQQIQKAGFCQVPNGGSTCIE